MEQDFFKGKIVIVTGAASGIGHAISRQLASQGATVYLADINFTQADTAAQTLNSTPGKGIAVQVDVTKPEQVQKVVEQVVAEQGRLDYIFNNAGFAISSEVRDMTLEQWDRILDVNLRGVINGVMAAYPVMIKQRYGHIVNTASLAGLVPSPMLTAYSTTKHAVVGLSTSLRGEAAALGVKVTAICPSFIRTNIFDAAIYNKTDKEKSLATIPFKLMDVDEAARQILLGVSKNRAIVTMPRYGTLGWWLYKLVPPLVQLSNRQTIKQFRKTRQA